MQKSGTNNTPGHLLDTCSNGLMWLCSHVSCTIGLGIMGRFVIGIKMIYLCMKHGGVTLMCACHPNGNRVIGPKPKNTIQKSISIVFCVSAIHHDSSLSKYRKQKRSPPGNIQNGTHPGGNSFCLRYLRIMTNSTYTKNNGDGLLYSILCQNIHK